MIDIYGKYFHNGSMLHICRCDNRYMCTIERLGEIINHHFDIKVIEDIEFKDVQKYDIYYQRNCVLN